MSHKGRCFRDRRKTKRRKLIQALKDKVKEIVMRPAKVYIPEVAEIPLPIIKEEVPLPKEYVKPDKEQSLKRRNW